MGKAKKKTRVTKSTSAKNTSGGFTSFAKEQILARYDLMNVSPDSARHWVNADSYSADTANAPEVRKKIREQARYEYLNNSYARGLVESLANDTVGTGPKLQAMSDDKEINKNIERGFNQWFDAVDMPTVLRTVRAEKCVSGESFMLIANNPKLPTDEKAFPIVLECDRVCASYERMNEINNIDGVVLDKFGNPVCYEYLTEHPGDFLNMSLTHRWDTVDAEYVAHWFRHDRPEQHRGISELIPALPLFAQLRRYTSATLANAEIAAKLSAVLYTENALSGLPQKSVPFETLDIVSGSMMTLPDGWKLGQFKPEQPINTYAEFKREILNEIGRCLQVPVNVMTGDSSKHNYASGRLDHQAYRKSIQISQDDMVRNVVERAYSHWFREFSVKNGIANVNVPHVWYWDGFEPIDPVKAANAQTILLKNKLTTLSRESSSIGRDWEVDLEQSVMEAARTRELLKKYNMSILEYNNLKGGEFYPESEQKGGDE